MLISCPPSQNAGYEKAKRRRKRLWRLVLVFCFPLFWANRCFHFLSTAPWNCTLLSHLLLKNCRVQCVSCWDWLWFSMCVFSGLWVLSHTPHPAEEPLSDDLTLHEYEWDGKTQGRPREFDDSAGKDQSIRDVWLLSLATDMIKWLNLNVCVCVCVRTS